jgi:protein O-GlcNAc transferase
MLPSRVPVTFDDGLNGETAEQSSSNQSELLAEARNLHRAGRLGDAQQLCRRVLQLQPTQPDALYRLARIAQSANQLSLATALLNRAVAARPGNRAFHKVLGDVLQAQGKPDQAIASYERALIADPLHAETHHNLAIALLQAGKPEEAATRLRQALALAPERAELHSNLLLVMQYLPHLARSTLFAESRDWATLHAARTPHQSHANSPDPERRLRVGYVSADFRRHPVGLFLEPVLVAHDPTQIEVFCYANTSQVDEVTKRLRSGASAWRTIAELADDQAADLIRDDGIDILVDLSGHTAGNRLPLFSRKPAPVQITWAGYSATTGLSAIDYFVADRFVCPEDEAEEDYFTERIARLPAYFLSYLPSPAAPEVSPAPFLSNAYVTFGCFNALSKVNAEVVDVWSEILRQVPNARLCLKADSLADGGVKARYTHLFAQHGISAERLELLPRSSNWSEYAGAFAQVDVALDPFPYNGGTTSIDGLWMGIPLVTLSGNRCVGRMGKGILSCLGLQSLVTHDVPGYVAAAVALAHDPGRMVELRGALRRRMIESPLCDNKSFARDLESLLRTIWQRWCYTRSWVT